MVKASYHGFVAMKGKFGLNIWKDNQNGMNALLQTRSGNVGEITLVPYSSPYTSRRFTSMVDKSIWMT